MRLALPPQAHTTFVRSVMGFILVGLLSFIGKSQVVYETQLIAPLDAMGVRHATVLPDESIVIAGTESIGNPFPSRKAVVFKHDEQGGLEASFEFQWPGNLHTDLVQAHTDIATGNVTVVSMSSGDPSRSAGSERLHLTELNSQLQPVQQVNRFDADSLSYQDFEVLADGGVLATAYSLSPTNGIQGYSTIRYSAQLDELWRHFEPLTQGSFGGGFPVLHSTDSTALVFRSRNLLTTYRLADGAILHVDTLNANLDSGAPCYAEANGASYLVGYDNSARRLQFLKYDTDTWHPLSWPTTNANFTSMDIVLLGGNDIQVILSGYQRVLSFDVSNDVAASAAMKSWKRPYALAREPFPNATKYTPIANWQGRQVFVGYHELRGKPQAGIYPMDYPEEERALLTLTDSSFVDEVSFAKLIPLDNDSMLIFTHFPDRDEWTNTVISNYIVAPDGQLVRKDTVRDFLGDRNYLGLESIDGGFALFHGSRSGYLRALEVSIFDHEGRVQHSVDLDSLPYSGTFPDKLQLGTDGLLHAFVEPISGPRVFVIDPSDGSLIRTTMLQDSSGTPVTLSPKLFCALADGGYFVYSGVSDLYRFDATGTLIEENSIGTSQSSRLPKRLTYKLDQNSILLEARQGRLYTIDLSQGISVETEISGEFRYLTTDAKHDLNNQTPVGSLGYSTARDSLLDHIWYALPNNAGQLETIPAPVELIRATDLDYLVQGDKLYLLRRTPEELGDAISLVVVALDGSVVNTSSPVAGDNLLVYPNPSNGIVNVDLVGGSMSNVLLFDLSGKLVFSETLDFVPKTQLSLPALAKGTYTLVAFDDNGQVYTDRIVVLE